MESAWKKEVPVNLTSHIVFTGRRDDVDEILHISDISVLCSNPETHGEGISNSILESMASGVPVIATIGGGTAEIVDNNVTGYLIKPKDIDDLSKKIVYLLENEKLRHKMGKSSRDKIEKYYSLEYMTEQYVNLYKTVEL